MDGLEWIQDVDNLSYSYLKGKALEFNPPVDDIIVIYDILDYLKQIGFDIKDAYQGIWSTKALVIGLYFPHNMDRVLWTRYKKNMDYQEHINWFSKGNVDLIDGWSLFKGIIKEDFAWIGDIPTFNRDKKMTPQEIIDFLKGDDEYISIVDVNGVIYHDWEPDDISTLGQIVDIIENDCIKNNDESIRSDFCKLYHVIMS